MRFGIGRPQTPMDVTAWVLERFSPEQEQALGTLVAGAADAIDTWLRDGLAAAMNRYNRAADRAEDPVGIGE